MKRRTSGRLKVRRFLTMSMMEPLVQSSRTTKVLAWKVNARWNWTILGCFIFEWIWSSVRNCDKALGMSIHRAKRFSRLAGYGVG